MSNRLIGGILTTLPQFFSLTNFENSKKTVEIDELWKRGSVELWNRGKLKVIFGAPGKRTERYSTSARAVLNKTAPLRDLGQFWSSFGYYLA
jgi:hypothetical protein